MRSIDAQKEWCIEYTGAPYLKRKDREALENAIDEHMEEILECVSFREKVGKSMLLNLKFVLHVEGYDGKYLMTIFNRSCDVIAMLTLNSYPCIGLNEAEHICREKGFREMGGWMLQEGSVRELLDRLRPLLNDYPQDPYVTDLKDRYEEALLKGIIAEDDSVQDADEKIISYLKNERF